MQKQATPKDRVEHGFWTKHPELLERLLHDYPHYGARVLARELRVSIPTIRHKVDRLGLQLLPRAQRRCYFCHKVGLGPRRQTGLRCPDCYSIYRAGLRRKHMSADPLKERLMEIARALTYRNKKRGLAIAVSFAELMALWTKQDGHCAYSGRPMLAESHVGRGRKPDSISVDRIDSGKGYIPGNIVLCTWWANVAKLELSPGDFILRCREVVALADNAS